MASSVISISRSLQRSPSATARAAYFPSVGSTAPAGTGRRERPLTQPSAASIMT